jgi:hypothetical protein
MGLLFEPVVGSCQKADPLTASQGRLCVMQLFCHQGQLEPTDRVTDTASYLLGINMNFTLLDKLCLLVVLECIAESKNSASFLRHDLFRLLTLF